MFANNRIITAVWQHCPICGRLELKWQAVAALSPHQSRRAAVNVARRDRKAA